MVSRTEFVRPTTRPDGEYNRIPDPERGGMLPRGGARVPLTSYWTRRLRAGEVERAHDAGATVVGAKRRRAEPDRIAKEPEAGGTAGS